MYKDKHAYLWHRRFAWLPTSTQDGWVWLRTYEARTDWHRPWMEYRRAALALLLLALVALPALATAQQAPVPPTGPEPGKADGMTIQECLLVLTALNALDQRRVIVAAGKPTESVETIPYKFPGKVRDAISHNIFVLAQVQQEAQAANRRAQIEIGAGETIKPGSKENLAFDQRMADYTARPCKVELDHIRDADFNTDENSIPGSILGALWKIRDK